MQAATGKRVIAKTAESVKINWNLNSTGSIIITDIILIAGLVLCLISDKGIEPDSAWRSPHCIISAVWFLFMPLHVWQHWKLIKALRYPKVRLRNKLTTLTVAVFIVMFLSIGALIVSTTPDIVRFHNVFAHLFMAVMIIHLIAKSKRLLTMIQRYK